MSEAKHTPGPWRIEVDEDTYGIMATQRGEFVTSHTDVAEVYRGGDARLIASAPDLLDIAEYIEQTGLLDIDVEGTARIRSAIAKAKGETQ